MIRKIKIYSTILLVLLMLPLSIESVDENIRVAKTIRHKHSTFAATPSVSVNINQKLPYIFKVSDKLIGNGEINIVVEGNKISGKAKGIGMTSQHVVDLSTNIDGILNNLKYIDVNVTGTGDPQGLIPGKISFSGPLMGELSENQLIFKGKVNIDGKLARCAGFEEMEDVSIEIQGEDLIQAYNEQKLKQGKLASL